MNFNPRPPCGGRRGPSRTSPCVVIFQSTSSVWRTTGEAGAEVVLIDISIHVLRVEDDPLR